MVADLYDAAGLHPEASLPTVGGKPVPDSAYLEEGDEVEFVVFTVHRESGDANPSLQ